MKKPYSFIVILCAVLLLASNLRAQAPMLINYQGRVTDASGNPRNGSFNMTFAFYDAAINGNKMPAGSPWEETQSVQVANGVFNVVLGSVVQIPSNLFIGSSSDIFGPLRFLDVKIDGESLIPRPRIVSGLYAIHADTARVAENPTAPGPPGPQGPPGPPGSQGPVGPTVYTVAACGIVDNPAAICECPFGTVANIKGPCRVTSTTGTCFTSDPSHRCCVCKAAAPTTFNCSIGCSCPAGTVARISSACRVTASNGTCFTNQPNARCCVCVSSTTAKQKPVKKRRINRG